MTRQYLTFTIDSQTYGFEIEKVREINRIGAVTKVPASEVHYTGVMNVRGSIIPVVSLRLKMGMPEGDHTSSTCTIIVDCGVQKVAIVVDAVKSVVHIEDTQIEKNTVEQQGMSFILEIAKLETEIVMLIDVEKCLLPQGEEDLATLKALAA